MNWETIKEEWEVRNWRNDRWSVKKDRREITVLSPDQDLTQQEAERIAEALNYD